MIKVNNCPQNFHNRAIDISDNYPQNASKEKIDFPISNKTNCIDILKKAGMDTVLMTGAGAEHCVLSTYHGALDLDITPVILKNGIAGATPEHIKIVENICSIISYDILKKVMEE